MVPSLSDMPQERMPQSTSLPMNPDAAGHRYTSPSNESPSSLPRFVSPKSDTGLKGAVHKDAGSSPAKKCNIIVLPVTAISFISFALILALRHSSAIN